MKFWKRPKYGNRKVTKNGETFDSVKEYERHLVLLDMQRRGEIQSLLRQPRSPLVVNESKICDYVGDWFYAVSKYPTPRGRFVEHQISVVEDAKGFQTPEFKLKWKLVRALYPHIDFRLS